MQRWLLRQCRRMQVCRAGQADEFARDDVVDALLQVNLDINRILHGSFTRAPAHLQIAYCLRAQPASSWPAVAHDNDDAEEDWRQGFIVEERGTGAQLQHVASAFAKVRNSCHASRNVCLLHVRRRPS
jgi:hypothetical protein